MNPEATLAAAAAAWRAELEALIAIGTALEGLDMEARRRALKWLVARWGTSLDLELRDTPPDPRG